MRTERIKNLACPSLMLKVDPNSGPTFGNGSESKNWSVHLRMKRTKEKSRRYAMAMKTYPNVPMRRRKSPKKCFLRRYSVETLLTIVSSTVGCL